MKIFISHSSKNKSYGDLIVEFLRSLGIKETEIIFTSNAAYGIPIGRNIFDWLRTQIQENPFVIYLLSEEYYESIACLNEMGAAWMIKNNHAAIFTPEFKLFSKEFQSGVLDPREMGFYINDEERLLSFVQLLSKYYKVSDNPILISQSVKRIIESVGKIKLESISENQSRQKEKVKEVVDATEIRKNNELPQFIGKSFQVEKGGVYSRLLELINANKLKSEEILLLHYLADTSNVKLKTGWQERDEVTRITEWEEINDINNLLSNNYDRVLKRFELRGFIEVSEVIGYDNPQEFKLKDEIAVHLLDLPREVLTKIEEVVKTNFLKHSTEDENSLSF